MVRVERSERGRCAADACACIRESSSSKMRRIPGSTEAGGASSSSGSRLPSTFEPSAESIPFENERLPSSSSRGRRRGSSPILLIFLRPTISLSFFFLTSPFYLISFRGISLSLSFSLFLSHHRSWRLGRHRSVSLFSY